ncbi:MAG: hypothetical protein LBK13_06515 [Spirochaetales bacterium]|jgi:hypothetical protein|nr:hypothetical protein [Spirochaetales bacterium]
MTLYAASYNRQVCVPPPPAAKPPHTAALAAALLICAALVFTACVSTATAPAHPEKPAALPGVVLVTGIPAGYQGGIILVSGSGENGETFTYSPKVLQKITGTRTEIKLYTEVSMIQKPFTGSGNYLVSVEIHKAGNTNDSERRYFNQKFSKGSAEIAWNTGSVKPPPAD